MKPVRSCTLILLVTVVAIGTDAAQAAGSEIPDRFPVTLGAPDPSRVNAIAGEPPNHVAVIEFKGQTYIVQGSQRRRPRVSG